MRKKSRKTTRESALARLCREIRQDLRDLWRCVQENIYTNCRHLRRDAARLCSRRQLGPSVRLAYLRDMLEIIVAFLALPLVLAVAVAASVVQHISDLLPEYRRPYRCYAPF